MHLLTPPGDKVGLGREALCPPTWAQLGHRMSTKGRDTAHASAWSQPTEKSASNFFN